MSETEAGARQGGRGPDPVGLSAAGDERLRIVYGRGSQSPDRSSPTGDIRLEQLDGNGRTAAVSRLDAVLSAIAGIGPATPVLTARGECAALSLRPGDRLISRDGRAVRVTATETRDFGWRVLGVNPFLRPLVIPAGTLAPGVPTCDLTLSQGSGVWLSDHSAADRGGMVQGVQLPALGLAQILPTTLARYVRIGLAEDTQVLCAGVWVSAPTLTLPLSRGRRSMAVGQAGSPVPGDAALPVP